MPEKLINVIHDRVLILDGAMGTMIHEQPLDLETDYLGKENCPEILNLTRPDVIETIHATYLKAGADAVETNTFGGMPHVITEFDLADRSHEICKAAAQIARRACDHFSTPEKPRFVFGSLGPGTKLITLRQISWEDMLASYTTAASGLIEGGADALLIETAQDLLQCKCAVNACIDAQRNAGVWETENRLPIFVQVTIETTGTMLLGSEIGAAIVALQQLPIDGIGLNCATGPTEMAEHVQFLSQNSSKLISILPNAGLPVLHEGQTVFPLQPDPFAQQVKRFVEEDGANIVGGCCGTTPEHIKALAQAVGDIRPIKRSPNNVPQCTSLYSPVDLKQELSILMIGERTNANGSRKFKQMLADEDWDGLVSWARAEVKGGAHVLDVCVDFVGRDGVKDITEVFSRYIQQIQVPLVLDSTEAPVIEAGLKLAPGKCIVNSINLEDGEERLNQICPLLKRYGAAVIALTIDENPQAGMAKTADRKLEIAERLHDLCVNKWDLDERDILFDPLTFTIATGIEADRKLGLETLDGIELIAKKLPECGILLGLSNISFGLKPAARQVLNSVFLHEAIQRGLTAAIVHPSKILPEIKVDPEHWQAALWLIYDKRNEARPEGKPSDFDPLLHFIGLFPDDATAASNKPKSTKKLTIEEQLQQHIIDGEKQDLEKHLDQAREKYSPLEIINGHLLEGMKVVGELFGSGQMQLPFVLQSAEVMKQSVVHLEQYMDKLDTTTKGRIVLATVKGDVHDIGKNLVDIILTNNGYDVVNLGIKQPLNVILEAQSKHQADAIGMSGLLVKSVMVMQDNLKQMCQQGLKVPTLLGGAALTRHYAETELRKTYDGPVYYGRDAFEALNLMQKISAGQTAELESAIDQRLTKRQQTEQKIEASKKLKKAQNASANTTTATTATLSPKDSSVRTDVTVPQAPFWGDRVVDEISLDAIYPYVNKVALYRGQWGYKKGAMSQKEYQQMLDEQVQPVFDELAKRFKDENLLQPKVVYGYWPCQSEGDDLIIYDANDHDKPIERFTFPRQDKRKRLCISDFFKSLASGQKDVIGFSCVTMGSEISKVAQKLFKADNYQQYLYTHGMGVECAEALAELWHKRMRQELGIDGDDAPEIRKLFSQNYRGSRYSFGYPACPEMSDQDKLFGLLRPDRIGCVLTDNWQIDPEQSTSALIVHHPDAKYFNV